MAFVAASIGAGLVLWAVSIAVGHEGDYWRVVPFGGLALLLFVDSVVLFHGRKWGRLVLSVTLHCLVLYLVAATVLEAIDATTIPSVLRRVAILLVPILCFTALIVAVHSSSCTGEPQRRRATDGDTQVLVRSGAGREDARQPK